MMARRKLLGLEASLAGADLWSLMKPVVLRKVAIDCRGRPGGRPLRQGGGDPIARSVGDPLVAGQAGATSLPPRLRRRGLQPGRSPCEHRVSDSPPWRWP